MRKTSFSAKTLWRSALSDRAVATLWPNGFSTTTREPSESPAAASCATTLPNSAGGMAK